MDRPPRSAKPDPSARSPMTINRQRTSGVSSTPCIRTATPGRGKQSWSVDYRVLEGDTSRAEVWQKLTEMLSERYPIPGGPDLPILRSAVDSGYATQEVYAWARK